jgi:hypothetical protein
MTLKERIARAISDASHLPPDDQAQAALEAMLDLDGAALEELYAAKYHVLDYGARYHAAIKAAIAER